MKIGGFEPDCKRVHLKKCLKKALALNLKFLPNRLKPAAGRCNCPFTIILPTRIGAIQRNILKIDKNFESNKMQSRSYLVQREV